VCNERNSAKRQMDDIVPQSAYVYVEHDGYCWWMPSFRWSVTHCSMDSTWFPFDEQYCELIYESWRYPVNKVNLTVAINEADGTYEGASLYGDFQPNDQWELIGKSLAFFSRCVNDQASGRGDF